MNNFLHPATWTWLALLALTSANYTMGALGLKGAAVIAVVLLTTLLKGQLVIDLFMGLRRVRLRWRLLLTGYLVFVLGLIALAYGLAI